tara:strand:+ start:943 stop:1104 length:162 start_codon:yes stop_codon:yes gene_type:complete
MSHLPEDLTRDNYVPTAPLASDASTAEIVAKINELVEKLEEVVGLFIGPSNDH